MPQHSHFLQYLCMSATIWLGKIVVMTNKLWLKRTSCFAAQRFNFPLAAVMYRCSPGLCDISVGCD